MKRQRRNSEKVGSYLLNPLFNVLYGFSKIKPIWFNIQRVSFEAHMIRFFSIAVCIMYKFLIYTVINSRSQMKGV